MQRQVVNQTEITAEWPWSSVSVTWWDAWVEDKASEIRWITLWFEAFHWSSLHNGHGVLPSNAACVRWHSTIESSTRLGRRQSFCSNIWNNFALSNPKSHSIIWLGLTLWWISESLWVCSEFHYANINRRPICKEHQIGCISLLTSYFCSVEHRFKHLCTYSTTAFHRSSVTTTEEIFCNRNWHTQWNVKSSAGGIQWPTGPHHL